MHHEAMITALKSLKLFGMAQAVDELAKQGSIERHPPLIERSRAALSHDAELQMLRDCHASLSRREREVMALVVSGLLNKQFSGEPSISEITVKPHRGKVVRKMKPDSPTDLVNMVAGLRLPTAPKG